MKSKLSATTNGVDLEASQQSELARVLDAYLAAVEAGEPVDPELLPAAHPEIAERLWACLSVLRVASEVEGSGDPKPPSSPPSTPISATSTSSDSLAAAVWGSSSRPSSSHSAAGWR
jgi:hypothetical protein